MLETPLIGFLMAYTDEVRVSALMLRGSDMCFGLYDFGGVGGEIEGVGRGCAGGWWLDIFLAGVVLGLTGLRMKGTIFGTVSMGNGIFFYLA